MLAFSGCYFGGGERERHELGEIRKRWTTLPVRLILTSNNKILSQWQDDKLMAIFLFSPVLKYRST